MYIKVYYHFGLNLFDIIVATLIRFPKVLISTDRITSSHLRSYLQKYSLFSISCSLYIWVYWFGCFQFLARSIYESIGLVVFNFLLALYMSGIVRCFNIVHLYIQLLSIGLKCCMLCYFWLILVTNFRPLMLYTFHYRCYKLKATHSEF